MALGGVDEENVSNVNEIFSEGSKGTDDGRGGIPSFSVEGFCGAQPLGYVLLKTGKLCPFGLLPPATEADALGDPAEWVEVRVNPPSLMWTSEEPFVCPAEFCREKMRKNYSMESHVRKHILMIVNRSVYEGLDENEGTSSEASNKIRGQLPPSVCVKYCCNAKECGYGLSVHGETKFFSCLKYLKQHYYKVHAPKTHQCDRCEKCFSTAGFLDTHQRMCGNTFRCSSCGSSYSTLEALQTHCKRKQHSYDYTKYKDILSSFRQIQQSKKAEEHLKLKLAAVSITSSSPETSSKKSNQLPILIPRPTTITLSVDGASASHVAWTYEDKSDVPRVRKEMATQTMTEESNEFKPNIDVQSKSSASQSVRNTKRKKSAETQTGKVTFRISTETQTSNVTKRRRTSKKQIAEAETQCTEFVTQIPTQQSQEESTPGPSYWISTNLSTESFMDTSPPQGTSADISAPFIMHLVDISSSPDLESKEKSLNFNGSQEFGANTANLMEVATSTTATIGVGNRFDEDLQELFDFNEELHQETQTDPIHFSSSSVSMSITPDLENFSIEANVFNNFTTAETQTLTGVSPPQVGHRHEGLQTHSTNSLSVSSHAEDWFSFLDSPGNSFYEVGPSNSPSFLETMDNETQTQSPYRDYEDFFKSMMNSESFDERM